MGTITLAKFSDIVGIDTKIGNTAALTSPSTTSIVNAINSIDTIGNTGTKIPLSANLNDYTTPGIYWTSADIVSSLTNAPLDLTYHESEDPLYDQWEDFKMIVSKLWEETQNIWDGSAYVPTQVGTIKQEITAGLGGETTAHFGKRWQRFYNIQTQTWGSWFIYLIAVDSNNGVNYIAPSRNHEVYDFGFNAVRIKRDLNYAANFGIVNESLTLGSSIHTGAAGGLTARDSNTVNIGVHSAGLTSDGDAYVQMYANNSSNSINQLQLTKKEDGSNLVSVTSPAAWRSAIGAAPILQRVSIATNKSSTLTSGTNYNIASYTFSSGLWLISFRTSIQSNSTGRRAIFMSASSNGTSIGAHANTNQTATNGATTNLGWMTMINFTNSTKYYFNAYQNSGATLTCASYISAIKLDE